MRLHNVLAGQGKTLALCRFLFAFFEKGLKWVERERDFSGERGRERCSHGGIHRGLTRDTASALVQGGLRHCRQNYLGEKNVCSSLLMISTAVTGYDYAVII